jgi:hypothetical protein
VSQAAPPSADWLTMSGLGVRREAGEPASRVACLQASTIIQ